MRFIKPLLAAAAILSIAAPAASALADPYWGGPGYDRPQNVETHYRRDGDGYRGDYRRDREVRREHAAWRYHMWREQQRRAHQRWEHRHDYWRD